VVRFEGREGKEKRERLFSSTGSGENLGGEGTPREHGVPPWINPPGSEKGFGFFRGRKPLKHTRKAERFFSEVQEGKDLGRPGFDHGRGGKL
jgi:hypothetical protein